MLIQHPHPQVIVADVLGKSQAYTGQVTVDLANLWRLVIEARGPSSMRRVFEVAKADALAVSPPDVLNGLVHAHIMKTDANSFF